MAALMPRLLSPKKFSVFYQFKTNQVQYVENVCAKRTSYHKYSCARVSRSVTTGVTSYKDSNQFENVKWKPKMTLKMMNNLSEGVVAYEYKKAKKEAMDDVDLFEKLKEELLEEQEDRFRLMDVPEVVLPNRKQRLKNWLTIQRVKIRCDSSFSVATFMPLAAKMVTEVSSLIGAKQLDKLDGIVDSKAIPEIKHNLNGLTGGERRLVRVLPEHIKDNGAFIFRVQIVKHEKVGKQVEITVVVVRADAIRSNMLEIPSVTAIKMHGDELYKDKEKLLEQTLLCNYKFCRSYTSYKEDSWKIKELNHFNLMDYTVDKANLHIAQIIT